jgi:hypothetical protein
VTPVETLTVDERKEALARAITAEILEGWHVESQSDYQAVMVKGRHVKHWLHGVLTVLTGGVWAVVWVTMWLLYHERRMVIDVGEHGTTNVQR